MAENKPIQRYRIQAKADKPTTLERALLGCREKTAGMHREQVARLPTFRNLQRPRQRVPLYRVQNCPDFWPKTGWERKKEEGRRRKKKRKYVPFIPQIRADPSLLFPFFLYYVFEIFILTLRKYSFDSFSRRLRFSRFRVSFEKNYKFITCGLYN